MWVRRSWVKSWRKRIWIQIGGKKTSLAYDARETMGSRKRWLGTSGSKGPEEISTWSQSSRSLHESVVAAARKMENENCPLQLATGTSQSAFIKGFRGATTAQSWWEEVQRNPTPLEEWILERIPTALSVSFLERKGERWSEVCGGSRVTRQSYSDGKNNCMLGCSYSSKIRGLKI